MLLRPGILSSHGSEEHYGVPGMRERAKLIGGKVTVWNEVDDGTEVELCVPRSEGLRNRSKGFVVVRKARRKGKGRKS